MSTRMRIWRSIIVIFFQLVIANGVTYMATPGEFPNIVAVFHEGRDMTMGILGTEEAVITTCTYVYFDGAEDHLVADNSYLIIASNGHWRQDDYRQERKSVFTTVHPKCSPFSDFAIFNVGAIVVVTPFRVTLYTVPVQRKAAYKPRSKTMAERLGKIINDSYGNNLEEDFVIGGFACPNGVCSMDSPVLRSFTKPLQLDDCHNLLDSNDTSFMSHLVRCEVICFPSVDKTGGPGTTVEYNLRTVAVGSTVRVRDGVQYLIATRFDIGMELLDLLYDNSATELFAERKITLAVIILCILYFRISKFGN